MNISKGAGYCTTLLWWMVTQDRSSLSQHISVDLFTVHELNRLVRPFPIWLVISPSGSSGKCRWSKIDRTQFPSSLPTEGIIDRVWNQDNMCMLLRDALSRPLCSCQARAFGNRWLLAKKLSGARGNWILIQKKIQRLQSGQTIHQDLFLYVLGGADIFTGFHQLGRVAVFHLADQGLTPPQFNAVPLAPASASCHWALAWVHLEALVQQIVSFGSAPSWENVCRRHQEALRGLEPPLSTGAVWSQASWITFLPTFGTWQLLLSENLAWKCPSAIFSRIFFKIWKTKIAEGFAEGFAEACCSRSLVLPSPHWAQAPVLDQKP